MSEGRLLFEATHRSNAQFAGSTGGFEDGNLHFLRSDSLVTVLMNHGWLIKVDTRC